ncbi:MAG: sugar transferase [Patescibacteria group bacterium]|jgi:exopolysaccharide biosynthesis polyprenyl glycosylphosphotransferase
MKNYNGLKLRKMLVFISTIGLFYASLWLTLILRYQENYNNQIWQMHFWPFTWLFLIWLVIFYALNLFDPIANQHGVSFLNIYLKTAAINLGLGFIYFYALYSRAEIRPRTVLIILMAIFTVLYFVWRKLLNKLSHNEKFYPNVLFVGYEPLIKEILPKNDEEQRFGYFYKGIVTDQIDLGKSLNLKSYNFNELNEVIKKDKISLLIINEPSNQEIINLLFKILPLRVNFISLSNFYENICQRIPLTIISRGWFLDNFSEGQKTIYETSKRLIDIVLSLLVGLVSLPFTPFIALAIKLNSKGPIIFKQIRVGKDGQNFVTLKFRTMYQNAEKSGAIWAKENDPRITTVGLFLRKTRLDEIPQLINIFTGEMSFVGPRPERPEFIELLEKEIPFYRERLLVKPGLTGWAQINFPYADSVESTLKKLQYDLYYVKNRSIFLDLSIILKTLNTILQQVGR